MAKNEKKTQKREYFTFYRSWRDTINALDSEEDQYELLKAIVDYALDHVVPDFEKDYLKALFVSQLASLDRSWTKFENGCSPKPQKQNEAKQKQTEAKHEQISNKNKEKINKKKEESSSSGNDNDYDHFMKWYNAAIRGTNIPNIIVMTDERQTLFDTIREKYGVDKIYEVVAKAIKSDYLNGEKQGTKMTIDWLFEEQNFVKVMEGKYND